MSRPLGQKMHYTFVNGLCTLQSIPTSVILQSQSSLQRKMHRKELRFVQRCISRWRSFFQYFTPLKDFSSLYFERSIQSVPSDTLLSKAWKKMKQRKRKRKRRRGRRRDACTYTVSRYGRKEEKYCSSDLACWRQFSGHEAASKLVLRVEYKCEIFTARRREREGKLRLRGTRFTFLCALLSSPLPRFQRLSRHFRE